MPFPYHGNELKVKREFYGDDQQVVLTIAGRTVYSIFKDKVYWVNASGYQCNVRNMETLFSALNQKQRVE